MLSDSLIEACHRIASGTPDRTAFTIGAVEASRVGRNEVWHLRSSGEVNTGLFVKRWADRTSYRREVWGLETLHALASSVEWAESPRLVLADEERGLIVTEALRGYTSLEACIRETLRYDRRLRGPGSQMDEIETLIQRVRSWSELLAQVSDPDRSAILDHMPEAILERVNVRIERVGRLHGFEAVGRLPRLSPRSSWLQCASQCQLIHGDMTPPNVLFDGEHVALLDFEDLGYGPGWRDRATLSYAFDLVAQHPLYASVGDLRERLEECWPEATTRRAEQPSLHALYDLELGLNHALLHASCQEGLGWWRRRLASRESKLLLRRIGELHRLVAER